MNNIDKIISEYIAGSEEKNEIEKRLKLLKQEIIEYANGADNFSTECHTVIIKITKSVRIDTKAVLKDFPDFKNEYGMETKSTSIIATETATETKAS